MADFDALKSDIKLSEWEYGAEISYDGNGDLESISEEFNLAQAILHRFRTGRGELSDIGFPKYGSDIYDVIGEPNNTITKNKLSNILRETLTQETRVKEIVSIFIIDSKNCPDIIDSKNCPDIVCVEIAVIPINRNEPIKISFSLNLDVI